MINIKESYITDILPEKLTSKPEVKALSYAVGRAVHRMLKYSNSTSVYADIDNADESILDLLAAELDTQYYDTTLDINAKRELVKHSIVWHMSAGTPAAVEELITAVFGEGKIEEWYEYGGEPYFFKILTNARLTQDMIEQFTRMLDKVKNARSHIDSIEIHRELEQHIYPLIHSASISKPSAIIDGYKENRDTHGNVIAVTHHTSVIHSQQLREGYSLRAGNIDSTISSCVGKTEYKKNPAIREEYSFQAEAIRLTITANNTAVDRYKSIIKE